MRRIEAKAIDVKLAPPVGCVLGEELAHGGFFEVQAVSPWRLVIRIEITLMIDTKIIAVRSQMVVNHIQNDTETARVRRVHQRTQIVWLSIGASRRIQSDAVVTPVPFSGKVGHRHDFDGVRAQTYHVIELRNGTAERACRSKRADVQFVDDQLGVGRRRKVDVAPGKRAGINYHRGTVHTLWLITRGRIRPALALSESVLIKIARGPLFIDAAEVAVGFRMQCDAPKHALFYVHDQDRDAVVFAPGAIVHAAGLDHFGALGTQPSRADGLRRSHSRSECDSAGSATRLWSVRSSMACAAQSSADVSVVNRSMNGSRPLRSA